MLKDGLSQVFKKRMNLTDSEYETRIQVLEQLVFEYSEKNHDLEGEIIKQRVQHVAAIAAADQKLEAVKDNLGRETDTIRRARDDDKTQLAVDVRNMRIELEKEVGNRRYELQDQKEKYEELLREERAKAASAIRRATVAEKRSEFIESKFGALDNEIRSMEEIHGKAQRIICAADEQDVSHPDLLNLLRDVNNWGKQLKSLRAGYGSLVASRGRPEYDEFLPSALPPADVPVTRRRSNSAIRRMARKI